MGFYNQSIKSKLEIKEDQRGNGDKQNHSQSTHLTRLCENIHCNLRGRVAHAGEFSNIRG